MEDMEQLYAACREKGRLADHEFAFMKAAKPAKPVAQPYTPPPAVVHDAFAFPVSYSSL